MTEPSPTGWRNKRTLLIGAATVLALAVVIAVAAALAPRDSTQPTTPSSQSAAEASSQLAYGQALEAEASGDTTKAVTLLERAVALDPANAAAAAKLKELKAELAAKTVTERAKPDEPGGDGAPPSSETTSKPTLPVPSDDVFLDQVKDITKLLPVAADGYSLGQATASQTDATKPGTPAERGAPVTRALWTVHDRGDREGAAEFVKTVSKALYAQDASQVKVDGATAYYGSDGARLVTVVYSRGRYVFELIVTTAGVPLAELKEPAVAAAQAFPDKP